MFEHLPHIARRLQPTYEPSEARALARWLVDEAVSCSWTVDRLDAAVLRLLNQEPIQHILGHVEWDGLDLRVTPDTLIPRPETAELCNCSASLRSLFGVSDTSSLRVLDIGTGSGCIALGLKHRHPEWDVVAVDISPAALEVARQNAASLHLSVDFYLLDILDDDAAAAFRDACGAFDLVVSNPPYICRSEATTMERNVLDYEPHSALFVPDLDPLLFYRRIAQLGWGKYIAFEINQQFGSDTVDMLSGLGYEEISLQQDQYGKDRFVFARRAL